MGSGVSTKNQSFGTDSAQESGLARRRSSGNLGGNNKNS